MTNASEAQTASSRTGWHSRLLTFVASGPKRLPESRTLFDPSVTETTDVLLPLVARRTLKRLLLVSLRLRASTDICHEWDRLISVLLELPDKALEAFLLRPETTALISRVEAGKENGAEHLPWLGQLVVAIVAANGGSLAPTRVARSTPKSVTLAAASVAADFGRSGSDPVMATVQAGSVTFIGEVFEWRPISLFAEHVGISAGPDAWMSLTFPGVEHVVDIDPGQMKKFIGSLEDATSVLRRVWPEACDETLAILRWIVPLAIRDSWYVPGMQGLIAMDARGGRRQVRDLFHETSHHKLSRILELGSASRNPDHLVLSPFAKGKGPVTSLLQSCWSFAREYELIRRLKSSGYLDPQEVAREELKFRVFFDKGIPVLRKEAKLSDLGEALVNRIEEAVH